MNSVTYNQDCLSAMREMPDKAFDLAIVDPPYGIGAYSNGSMGGGVLAKQSVFKATKWDSNTPDDQYFNELTRVSKNQIVWGINFYKIILGAGRVVWDKENGDNNFSDCELAYQSFTDSIRIFRYRWQGMLQGDMKNKETRIHPTQKPIALYKWLLTKYAKPGDKILDTHLGSGSSRIAAYDLGFDFTGYELDKDYFNAQEERFARHIAQPQLFEIPRVDPIQEAMFAAA